MAQIHPNQSKEAIHNVWSWGIDFILEAKIASYSPFITFSKESKEKLRRKLQRTKRERKEQRCFVLSIFRMLPGLNFVVIELQLLKCFRSYSFQTQQCLFRIFAMDFTFDWFLFLSIQESKRKITAALYVGEWSIFRPFSYTEFIQSIQSMQIFKWFKLELDFWPYEP
jgi:hypothetical protein